MKKFFTFLFTLIIFSSCTSGKGSHVAESEDTANAAVQSGNGEEPTPVPESGGYKLFPHWKKGDIRYVHQVAERSTVTSRVNEQVQLFDFKYRFRVLKVDDFITVELYQKNLDIPIPKESYREGSIERVIQMIAVQGREFMNEFPFKVKIHKRTGDVVKILNREKFVQEYTKFCDSIVLANYIPRNDAGKKLFEVAHELNLEKANGRLNTLKLAANYLLQMYGLECEVGGKKSKDTYLNDEITQGKFSGGEMPTTLTIVTEKVSQDLHLAIDYSLDPADFLEAMDGKYANIEEAGKDNIEQSLKQSVVFNTTSGWPKKFESVTVMQSTSPYNEETVVVTEKISTTFHTKNF